MSEHAHEFISNVANHILDTIPEVGGLVGGALGANLEPSYKSIMMGALIGGTIGWFVKKGLDLAYIKVEKYYNKKTGK